MRTAQEEEEVDDEQIALAMLRAFRDMTQEEVAAAAGIGKASVSLQERGRQKPRRSTFQQSVQGMDVEPLLVEDLLRWIRAARADDRRKAGGPWSALPRVEAAAEELRKAYDALLREGLALMERRRP